GFTQLYNDTAILCIIDLVTNIPQLKYDINIEFEEGFTWAPCGDILFYWFDLEDSTRLNYFVLDKQTGIQRTILDTTTLGYAGFFRYAPDCTRFAVYWQNWDMDQKTGGLWIVSLTEKTTRLVHDGLILPIRWSSDGQYVYAWNSMDNPYDVVRIHADTGFKELFFRLPFDPSSERINAVDMVSNAYRFICSVEETVSDIWMIRNFNPEVK
ncbi:hypothetical protein BVY00_01640, partial [bacterium G20]